MRISKIHRYSRKVRVVAISTIAFLFLAPLPASASPPHSVQICNYDQLEVAVAWGPGAAAGHVGIPFLIANTGTSACALSGYPKLAIYPASGSEKKPIRVIDGGGMVYVAVKPKRVTIEPGADASFGLNFVDALNQNDTDGPACIAAVYVTLPVRYTTFPQNYETTVDFNFCYSGFAVAVTAIQPGPVPREG